MTHIYTGDSGTTLGKVIWWDEDLRSGILKDRNNRVFYFDLSDIRDVKVDVRDGYYVSFVPGDLEKINMKTAREVKRVTHVG